MKQNNEYGKKPNPTTMGSFIHCIRYTNNTETYKNISKACNSTLTKTKNSKLSKNLNK